MSTPDRMRISVIVPVHDQAAALEECLRAVVSSTLPRRDWELVVVDDASTDESALVAAEFADTVVRLAGPTHGSGYARNRGVEASRGEVIVFLHADVRVYPDTLARLCAVLDCEPGTTAVSGVSDAGYISGGLASRYGQLLTSFKQRRGAGVGGTFWSGCGAVRAAAFRQVGGYDEWQRPGGWIADADFTCRLRRAGFGVRVRPDLPVVHERRWTLGDVLTEFFWRQPLTRAWCLGGHEQRIAGTGPSRVEGLVGAFLLVAAMLLLAPYDVARSMAGAAAGGAVVAALLLHRDFFAFMARHGGVETALWAVPVQLLRHIAVMIAALTGLSLRTLFGPPRPPVTIEAQALAGVETWPPAPAPPGRNQLRPLAF